MSDYTIRPATREDYPRITTIWKDAVEATHDFLKSEDFIELQGQIVGYLDGAELYVYDDAGTMKGFLGVDGDMIDMLFVSERGTGIGGRLLRYAVETLGARRLDVNEQNESARRFYENKGFAMTGRSETDSGGRPYPLLHMELNRDSKEKNANSQTV